jgi:DNA invertase Pin-like site-specific DNA recombinase
MIYGYARVSTESQLLDLQINALKGCNVLYKEKTSGIKQRPELDKLLNIVKPGDVIKIYKLDRLGRSTIDLINIVNNLKNKGVELISITDNIDTTSAAGKLIFTVFAAFAEFERNLIVERTNAGLKAAKKRGQKLGPKFKWTEETIKEMQKMRKQRYTVKHIAKTMNIPQSSIYKLIKLKNNTI